MSWFKMWVLMKFAMDFTTRYNIYINVDEWSAYRDLLGGVWGEREFPADHFKSFVVVSADVVPLATSIVILGVSYIFLSLYILVALLPSTSFNPLRGIAIFELVSFILGIFVFFLSRRIIKKRAEKIYKWTHNGDGFSVGFLQNLIMTEKDVDALMKIQHKRERVVRVGEIAKNIDPSIGATDAAIKRQ